MVACCVLCFREYERMPEKRSEWLIDLVGLQSVNW